jgi:hypothetical protein
LTVQRKEIYLIRYALARIAIPRCLPAARYDPPA